MPLSDMHCTKCNSDFKDVYYKYQSYVDGLVSCPECKEVGGMETRFNPGQNASLNYAATPRGDAIATSGSAFKELLGAIKKGTKQSALGENLAKY